VLTSRRLLVALLCLAWILPGLIGHDPWKTEEAYNFGVVYEMVRGGSWIAPALAGEPFTREPPLYYVTAALTGIAFSPILPLHDGARLASGLYIALALLFCGLASRELHGPGAGTLAAVLLLGSLGLVVRGHQLVPHVAGMAGFAIAYYGCARALKGLSGGVWLGTGVGIVFLSLGIPEAAVVAIIAALLPLVSSAWRSRTYAVALGVALVAALPWLLVWPLLLHAQSEELFRAWLEAETLTRLFRGGGGGFYYLRILPWYSWPLWPLALWALWKAFGSSPVKPAITMPLTGLLVTLLALSEAPEKRELYALPLLVPLALLATPGAETLRRGAANAWYWFSVMGFTFFILVAWVYWSGLELGIPARLHAHLHRIGPGYTPGLKLLPFILGVLYSAAWVAVVVKLERSPQRPAHVWAVGVTVLWALAATLFIGWIDTGKTYRGVFASMETALPPTYRCMASRDLGEPQRALLHYFADIVTHREEVPDRRRDCDLMLVQGTPQEEVAPEGEWIKIWEGSRPGDRSERYRLYRRLAAAQPPRTERAPPAKPPQRRRRE
jgi:4-amino-4-deoxy-L-arabinose transferase-like glycosyltransferase